MVRPLIFGVINVTPDSFSDGGRHFDPQAAIARGLQLVEEGADVLDIGGESTRPSGSVYGAGQRAIAVSEELDRVLPVIEGLQRATHCPLSIDTRKGAVARAAVAAGARWVNDVSGGTYDADLLTAAAESGQPLVLMHMRGTPETMASLTAYADVAGEVAAELEARIAAAVAAGVRRSQIWIDPGLGFAKTPAQSRALLRRLPELAVLGLPILIGASRKALLGSPLPPDQRLPESLVAAVLAVAKGAAAVRVHDVAATARALRFAAAVEAQA